MVRSHRPNFIVPMLRSLVRHFKPPRRSPISILSRLPYATATSNPYGDHFISSEYPMTFRAQENTLVDDQGNILLCDFGVSKFISQRSTGLTTTNTGKSWTIRYAAPELLRQEASHTLKTDVWAWGCFLLEVRQISPCSISCQYLMLFQTMTDKLPYESCDMQWLIIKAITSAESPADVTALPIEEGVKALLQGCWEQAAESRITMTAVVSCGIFNRSILAASPDHVLSEYKTSGEAWSAVHGCYPRRHEFRFASPVVLSEKTSFV